MIATCHTGDCTNAGIGIVVEMDPPPDLVACGVCGEPITDLGGA